jgi:hypothetical protein
MITIDVLFHWVIKSEDSIYKLSIENRSDPTGKFHVFEQLDVGPARAN